MSDLFSFLNILWKALFIVFFFGFCVFIHEFGHLLAALWQKLHVEKFSIGFGKRIWGFTYKGVEYAIGWLPFGGFVSLPQLDPTDTPETSDKQPLEPAHPWPRAITAFAGPAFNVLFGFLLAAIMWGVGLYEAPPATSCLVNSIPQVLPQYVNGLDVTDQILAVNGEKTDKFLEELCQEWTTDTKEVTLLVQKGNGTQEIKYTPVPNPEWEAGLRKGDRIVAVNGKHFTRGSQEFLNEYVLSNQQQIHLEVMRQGTSYTFSFIPCPNALLENLSAPFFTLVSPLTVDSVQKNSLAESAGLLKGDQLLQFNEMNILDSTSLQKMLKDNGSAPFNLTICRKGAEQRLTHLNSPETKNVCDFGLRFAVMISTVMPGSPAQEAGLQPHDKIIQIDQETFASPEELTRYIRSVKERPLSITVMRGDSKIVIPQIKARKLSSDQGQRLLIGISTESAVTKIIGHPTPWKQFTHVLHQTTRTLGLLFKPVTSVFSGKPRAQSSVKLQHMSGPLGIVMMLWYSLRTEGLRGGLALIILISFSLAFMNLLPIPVLDGGHILFALIEIIICRRLPTKFLVVIQNLFAVLLIALFLYISFFDGRRMLRLFKTDHSKPVHVTKPATPSQELELKPSH